ncbi:hypothetical protein ACFW6E_36230 [Streptomyces olivaceoviridis]|uniref:hypothetical protein n=1 Tax=Streptomyces olivaceoviridis TaxID=1921 RepID=UPI0036B14CCB
MKLDGFIALAIGANRGMCRHFAKQMLKCCAAKAYATARQPVQIDLPGAAALRLDITTPPRSQPQPRQRPTRRS